MITNAERNELARVAQKYPNHFMAKLFRDPGLWQDIATQFLGYLKLPPPPLRILDLGCGVGYFVRACRDAGHETHGLDVPDNAIEEAAACLGVLYCRHRIEAQRPLPNYLGQFDIITMMGVNLRTLRGAFWGQDEYRQFWLHLRGRLLDGGRWVIFPNEGENTQHLFSVDWWRPVCPEAKQVVRLQRRIEVHV